MIIKFDNTIIDNKYIMRMNQKATLFTENFQLGSTLCRTIEMDVWKEGVSQQPTDVIIEDDQGNRLFTMQVDSVNQDNINYYSYFLTDKMVNFNVEYDWSILETPTVQNIINAMCEDIIESQIFPTIEYLGDLEVNWSTGLVARDFISYVAEVNGSFARLDNNGNLEFVKLAQERITSGNLKLYENGTKSVDGFYYAVEQGKTISWYSDIRQATLTHTHIVDVNYCADFRVGELHKIEKVYLDLGVASQEYPHQEVECSTLYLNENNILFTDSQGHTIEEMVKHIYDIINGYEFYTARTSRCVIDDRVQAGDSLAYVLDDNVYMSIAQIDWNYNTQWYGGYELNISTDQQEHTQIQTQTQKINNINIKVDREVGRITQEITNLETDINAKFELYVDKDNLISYINASADEIILDGSKIIFGDLDNKYITIENYEVNNQAVGVSFDGNGYVRFRPQEEFSINNLSSDGVHNYNQFIMGRTPSTQTPRVLIYNYNVDNDYKVANQFSMLSSANSNDYNLANYKVEGSQFGNQILLSSADTNSYTKISNYRYDLNKIANDITMNAMSSMNNIKISNNNKLSENYTSNEINLSSYDTASSVLINNYLYSGSDNVINKIQMYSSETGSYVSINNKVYNSNVIANEFNLSSNTTQNFVGLSNYDSSGNLLNSLMLSNSTNATIGMYSYKQTSPGQFSSNARIIVNGTDGSVIINGHKLTFSNGNVGYTNP